MVQEARLEDTDGGLAPSTDGWFVVNLRDAAWVTNDVLGFKSPLGTAVYGMASLGIYALVKPAANSIGYLWLGSGIFFLALALRRFVNRNAKPS